MPDPETQAERTRAVTDEVACALAEQAQTTDTLTDAEQAEVEQIIRWHVGCHMEQPDRAYLSLAVRNTIGWSNRILASRSAGDRDARRYYLTEAIGIIESCFDPWHPYDVPGLQAARAAVRRALGDADDQHDGSGT